MENQSIQKNHLSNIAAGEYRSKMVQAFKAQDDQSVIFSNLAVEYMADSQSIAITFDLRAINPQNEIWSVSPMVMTDAIPLYAISQLSMAGPDGFVPFGTSLVFRNTTLFPVSDAIKGQTVQVGVAGFIWSEETPWGLFSSKTINLNIPS